MRPEGAVPLPQHVAIIMDGNGRWAQQRHQPRTFGHRAGGKAGRRAIEAAYRAGVRHLTLFAFSSENWARPEEEVGVLMRLFLNALEEEVDELHENEVRIRFIGDRAQFSPALDAAMLAAERRTAGNRKLSLNVAVGYGGRWDLAQAARSLAEQVRRGALAPADVDERRLGAALSLADTPDPDLLIRTGGEQRISNFLIWQMAYTELYFTDLLWPDFDEKAFRDAMAWYLTRIRRFGQVGTSPARNAEVKG